MITGVAKNRNWVWPLVWFVLVVALGAIIFGGYLWWKATTATVPACTPQQLALTTSQDAELDGVNYVHAVLTNKSDNKCTVNGYPTATMLDSSGLRLGASDAQYSDAFALATVTLAAGGGQAYALLGFPDVTSFSAGVCSDKSITLRIYLPGAVISPNTQSLTAPLQKQVCPGFSVAVFQPGS